MKLKSYQQIANKYYKQTSTMRERMNVEVCNLVNTRNINDQIYWPIFDTITINRVMVVDIIRENPNEP